MPVERISYRDAMSRLGAAVNVITTGSKGARHGFTASAVCSVTDEPPTLLVCMNRKSSSREEFFVGAPLCVNTLAGDQREISTLFATGVDMERRFAGASWGTLVSGAPVLDRAVAAFDGFIANILEVGTHSVLFCEIEAVRTGDVAHGLVYFDRRYHGLEPHDRKKSTTGNDLGPARNAGPFGEVIANVAAPRAASRDEANRAAG